jgi:hypothetical protein
MKTILPLLFLIAQVGTAPTAREAVERIRAKTPVEAVVVSSAEQLAGRYTSAPKEKEKRIGPVMGGFDLHLFPDGTFVFCNWTDISPLTVFDKGAWKLVEGLVTLTSDQDITWNPSDYYNYDRRYVAVRRSPAEEESLLVGVDDKLPYFEAKAGDDPGFMLLVVALKREATIDRAKAATLKARLMKKAWRPQLFQEKAK